MRISRYLKIKFVTEDIRATKYFTKALSFLNKRDRKSLRLLFYLNLLYIYRSNGYLNQLFNKEKVYMLPSKLVFEASTAYLASLLAHEARHLYQLNRFHKRELLRRHSQKFSLRPSLLVSKTLKNSNQ